MKHIISFLFSILCLSCIKEVEYNLPPSSRKLVIGSYFTANSFIDVNITRTQPSNDTLYNIDGDVRAYISTGEDRYKLQKINKSVYRSPFKAKLKQSYFISVSVDGFEEVYAKDSVPAPINFVIDKYIPTVTVDNEGENISAFQITINNIPVNRTYFELRMKYKRAYNGWEGYQSLESNDDVVSNEGLVNLVYDKIGLLFTNELINSNNKTLLFTFFDYIDDESNKIANVEIQLRTVSKNYFEYKKKLYLNLANQAGDLWDGTGSPVEAYTNIENGFGIFAGYSQTSQYYILP